jgi:hypothetical protein
MAEVDSPSSPTDWDASDRLNFSARWNRANVLNLMRGAAGAEEYKSISQRTSLYNWYDEMREVQGHEVLWPGAAWIVASQMKNLDDPSKLLAIKVRSNLHNLYDLLATAFESEDRPGSQVVAKLVKFGNHGNKAIFDDVFPKLATLFQDGLKGKLLKGEQAKKWDEDTLRHEQFDVVDPIYKIYTKDDKVMVDLLTAMASGSGVFAIGGVAIAGGLDFSGDILNPADRYKHGMVVVTKFYNQFKGVIDASRQRRHRSRADPTAGGMVKAA